MKLQDIMIGEFLSVDEWDNIIHAMEIAKDETNWSEWDALIPKIKKMVSRKLREYEV